jgi:hypothetical protein
LCDPTASQGAGQDRCHVDNRTRGGRHEVDLIVERDDGRVIAIEVKLGADGICVIRRSPWPITRPTDSI